MQFLWRLRGGFLCKEILHADFKHFCKKVQFIIGDEARACLNPGDGEPVDYDALQLEQVGKGFLGKLFFPADFFQGGAAKVFLPVIFVYFQIHHSNSTNFVVLLDITISVDLLCC